MNPLNRSWIVALTILVGVGMLAGCTLTVSTEPLPVAGGLSPDQKQVATGVLPTASSEAGLTPAAPAALSEAAEDQLERTAWKARVLASGPDMVALATPVPTLTRALRISESLTVVGPGVSPAPLPSVSAEAAAGAPNLTTAPPTPTGSALLPQAAASPEAVSPVATQSAPSPSPTLSRPTDTPVAPRAPMPTATPPPTPSSEARPAMSAGPVVREASVTINTYDYQSALVATTPEDPVYPYPRLNHDQVGPPAPKQYRAIVLENQYLELTILPELGGRIYRWVDKASGQNLFYQNPVIKPTHWGNRGWWLATGGMEWALPTDEHGLNEASPWEAKVGQYAGLASVTLTNTEQRSGLVAEITIKLDAEHSYFTLVPRILNPGSERVAYKFWINGMFSLGAHQVGPGIEFVLPGNQVLIHSSGDPALPGAGQLISWPVFNGRNLADYGTWTKYLGVFAAPQAQAGFMGAYNHNTNLGVVRVFPHLLVRGAKIFAPGDLDPKLWTVDGSSYFELWGGLAPTFADEVTLEPGQSVVWEERWYAVGDMGGFSYANQAGALNLGLAPGSVQVAATSTRWMSGRLVLWRNGKQVNTWAVAVSPVRPFRGSYTPSGGDVAGPWGLSLLDETGNPVLAIGQTGSALAGAQGGDPAASGLPAAPAPAGVPAAPPQAEPLVILDRDGHQRDWAWVEQEFGYELRRAPLLSGDGRAFRLVKLQESEAGPVYLVELRDEAGQPLNGTALARAWPDAPLDVSGYAAQSWNGLTRAEVGFPDANGSWGIQFEWSQARPPGQGEFAFFVLSPDIPSDVLARVAPLQDTAYRVLRPTFQLRREAGIPGSPGVAGPAASPPKAGGGGTAAWDARLDQLGITVTRAQAQPGQTLYRLVAARFQDEAEAKSLHHVYIEVLDESGRRIVGQRVIMAWDDGQSVAVTEDKPAPEYAANVPMYNYLGKYRVYVDGGPSDVVNGLGLPGKRHVCYLLTFQRKRL